MFEAKVVVQNEAGIHCRPSAVLVQEGMSYPGEILVIADSGTCSLTSALELIMLGLEQGAVVVIQVSGPDEDVFGQKLVDLFGFHFDCPPL